MQFHSTGFCIQESDGMGEDDDDKAWCGQERPQTTSRGITRIRTNKIKNIIDVIFTKTQAIWLIHTFPFASWIQILNLHNNATLFIRRWQSGLRWLYPPLRHHVISFSRHLRPWFTTTLHLALINADAAWLLVVYLHWNNSQNKGGTKTGSRMIKRHHDLCRDRGQWEYPLTQGQFKVLH